MRALSLTCWSLRMSCSNSCFRRRRSSRLAAAFPDRPLPSLPHALLTSSSSFSFTCGSQAAAATMRGLTCRNGGKQAHNGKVRSPLAVSASITSQPLFTDGFFQGRFPLPDVSNSQLPKPLHLMTSCHHHSKSNINVQMQWLPQCTPASFNSTAKLIEERINSVCAIFNMFTHLLALHLVPDGGFHAGDCLPLLRDDRALVRVVQRHQLRLDFVQQLVAGSAPGAAGRAGGEDLARQGGGGGGGSGGVKSRTSTQGPTAFNPCANSQLPAAALPGSSCRATGQTGGQPIKHVRYGALEWPHGFNTNTCKECFITWLHKLTRSTYDDAHGRGD